ncbi:unnamed protein product [Prorocentrum cordatum]|uniref:DNA2/NAM7 helicase-like C-terminal domain-containing protein n=1 Tax=Prorocentrum cordatum TaxID=2364126 RepID=A0ABN9TKG2_9DINO|nr:unnamed protein product [Polarella glacialis]
MAQTGSKGLIYSYDVADLVILATTRANSSHAWGFLNDRHQINVAYTRSKAGIEAVGHGKMFHAASDSKLNVLARWGLDAGLWLRFASPEAAGNRSMATEAGHGPVAYLPPWLWVHDEAPKEGAERIEAERARKAKETLPPKVRNQQELSFAALADSPLPEDNKCDHLAENLKWLVLGC